MGGMMGGRAAYPLLEVCGVSLAPGGQPMLHGIDFAMQEGEGVALCGPSGSGKTSLLRAIAGLDPIADGKIFLDGKLRNRPGRACCGKGEVGMVFQGEQLYRHLTLLDNVTLAPRKVLGVPLKQAEASAMELLDSVGLASLAQRRPFQMSGGERQRGAIARALALKPRLMLFDEPTSALDPSCVRSVLDLILALRDKGTSMIVVTHDLAFARAVSDAMLIMERGSIGRKIDPACYFSCSGRGTADHIFGEALSDVSSADRLRLGNAAVMGVACAEDRERAERDPLVQRLRARGHAVEFRMVRPEDAPLALRLHLADCVLARGEMSRADGIVRMDGNGQGMAAYVAAGDVLWQKMLAGMLELPGREESLAPGRKKGTSE